MCHIYSVNSHSIVSLSVMNSNSYRDAQLIHAGKGYAIMFSIWGSDHTYREEFINLLSIEPKISDLLTDWPLADLMQQLDKGRNEFRDSQVHSISSQMSGWGVGVPEDKKLCGFGNNVCHYGADTVPYRTHEEIQTFQVITIDDLPVFLWENEQVDPQDMNKGFLCGELLVKVLLSILIGPAAARPRGQSSGAGGYANIIARYALSAESTCRWSFKSETTGFNHLKFYQRIIFTVGTWKDEEQQLLLMWWSRMVLTHLRGGPHATQLDNTPAPSSAAVLMMQQAVGMTAVPH
ncbi:hypothetical protein BJ322DRAFT_1024523 [Thelephora terrestris]|uniref:Uncharacterized protein n=1 Tax=Thelephora terrestris TaxID=56493 RepID=A0A9P6H570_9AGAM|nr:hypothetical protein BJ322DRAFT_1024523 [Thelephora terrestris]